ncbi:hypothetical protein GKODMF_12800 [Candidatus Electrothrix gigas]
MTGISCYNGLCLGKKMEIANDNSVSVSVRYDFELNNDNRKIEVK